MTTFDSGTTRFGEHFDTNQHTFNAKSSYGLSDLEQIKVWAALSSTSDRVIHCSNYEELSDFLITHNLNDKLYTNAISVLVGDTVTINTPYGMLKYTEHTTNRIIDLNDF